jgi:hypothetical protein
MTLPHEDTLAARPAANHLRGSLEVEHDPTTATVEHRTSRRANRDNRDDHRGVLGRGADRNPRQAPAPGREIETAMGAAVETAMAAAI